MLGNEGHELYSSCTVPWLLGKCRVHHGRATSTHHCHSRLHLDFFKSKLRLPAGLSQHHWHGTQMSSARLESSQLCLKGSVTCANCMTNSMCPLRSKFSHLPRTLNLALPLCPATSSSPATSCLFPASSVRLSCCVSKPGILSFCDLTPLCWHTCLCRDTRQGWQDHSTQVPLASSPSRLDHSRCQGRAFRAELLTSGAPQSDGSFWGTGLSRAVKQLSCFSTELFNTKAFFLCWGKKLGFW